jgi:hypothetical protein
MTDKLYEIVEQHQDLAAMVEREELSAEDIADTVDALEGEFGAKADSLIRVVKGFDGDIDAIDAEIKRLQARKSAFKNRQQSLREYLKFNMQKTGIKQIKCPLFTISLAAGRDQAVIDNPDDLPDDLVEAKVAIQPKKAEILRKLKAGDDVPGARLEKTEDSVRIR